MHVLFLCPHAAAKSVVAAALLRDRADRDGLDVTASNAGTEPDDAVNPIAAEALRRRGLASTGLPRPVRADDIEAADLVVSFGCRLEELPTGPRYFVDWSDLPDVSDDVDAFCRQVAARFDSLLRAARERRSARDTSVRRF